MVSWLALALIQDHYQSRFYRYYIPWPGGLQTLWIWCAMALSVPMIGCQLLLSQLRSEVGLIVSMIIVGLNAIAWGYSIDWLLDAQKRKAVVASALGHG